jgi:cysteine desulfurase / selenocysteine lyase
MNGAPLLEALRGDFIGIDTRHCAADGRSRRRIYLDSAATTLMMSAAHATATAFLQHNANTHSRTHFSAHAAAEAYAFARERVLSFIDADPARYLCLFVGHGATAALNRAAHYLCAYRPQAGHVVVSSMEHHSNDLPHRRVGPVQRATLTGTAPALGAIDAGAFATLMRDRPRYAAVSLASNVTGIVNPIAELSAAARSCGVPILVDACQAIAHLPVSMRSLGEPDALVFSGHKVYAPGSPGVLVIRRDIVEAAPPAELGGGMVSDVSARDFTLACDLVEREEAGTPNVVGAVTLGAALEVLARIGMDVIAAHERVLTEHLVASLLAVDALRVYGSTDLAACPRVGVASFNLADHGHGWVAAALNDHYNIAVRDGCFCAQPYARSLLAPELWALEAPDDVDAAERVVQRRRGMVRASLGLYSMRADVDALASALREIGSHPGRYRTPNRHDDEVGARHEQPAPPAVWQVRAEIDRLLTARWRSAHLQPA